MSKKFKRLCLNHDVPLEAKRTRYGVRWGCPVEGCTVVCWNGNTSMAADLQTRQARQAAHAAFDPLHQAGELTKGEAYKQLAAYMGLPQKKTHIGHFDIQQCLQVLAFCERKCQTRINNP